MNALTYTLNSSTLATGTSAFETGLTSITLDFSGIHDADVGYFKFVTDFDDGSDHIVTQDSSDTWGLSSTTLSHTFYPSTKDITTYNVTVSGFRTDLTTDTYKLNLKISKPSVSTYKDIKIISSQLYTSPDGKNNLTIAIETQSPHFVGNMVIPYDKIDLATIFGTPKEVLQALDLDKHLRTEVYSAVGGLESIITEQHSAFIIREDQLTVLIMGNEHGASWSGHAGLSAESIALIIDENVTMYDINGDEVSDPALILIPEFDTPQSDGNKSSDYTQQPGIAYRL